MLDLSPAGQVVIHHDLAAEALPWNGRPPERVHFVDRATSPVGGLVIVAATLRMIRYAHDELDADWYVMLSGEHNPSSTESVGTRTMATEADAFVEALSLQLDFGRHDEDANRFLARCLHRWVTISQPRQKLGNKAMGALWRVSRYVLPLFAIEYSHRRNAWFFASPRRRGRPAATTSTRDQSMGSTGALPRPFWTDGALTEWFTHGHIPDETSTSHRALQHTRTDRAQSGHHIRTGRA